MGPTGGPLPGEICLEERFRHRQRLIDLVKCCRWGAARRYCNDHDAEQWLSDYDCDDNYTLDIDTKRHNSVLVKLILDRCSY